MWLLQIPRIYVNRYVKCPDCASPESLIYKNGLMDCCYTHIIWAAKLFFIVSKEMNSYKFMLKRNTMLAFLCNVKIWIPCTNIPKFSQRAKHIIIVYKDCVLFLRWDTYMPFPNASNCRTSSGTSMPQPPSGCLLIPAQWPLTGNGTRNRGHWGWQDGSTAIYGITGN